MFPKIRLALRLINSLAQVAKELRTLSETLTAATILLNTKPLRLDKTLSLDKSKVDSTLLWDVLNTRQDPIVEIVDFKDEEELAQDSEAQAIMEARRKIDESRFQAWRGERDERII